jgi:hypothetical protein
VTAIQTIGVWMIIVGLGIIVYGHPRPKSTPIIPEPAIDAPGWTHLAKGPFRAVRLTARVRHLERTIGEKGALLGDLRDAAEEMLCDPHSTYARHQMQRVLERIEAPTL